MTTTPSLLWYYPSASQLRILDQRRLPAETTYPDCATTDSVIDAIKTLAVRGAPAIGLAVARIAAWSDGGSGSPVSV